MVIPLVALASMVQDNEPTRRDRVRVPDIPITRGSCISEEKHLELAQVLPFVLQKENYLEHLDNPVYPR